MGYRFRKSKNIGKYFRVNVSNKGIGYSIGTKGFRVSVGSDGKIRQTTSIPGTGISHTQTIHSSQYPSHSTHVLLPFFLIIGIVFLLLIGFIFISTLDQPSIPSPPESTYSAVPAPPFSFKSDYTVFLSYGNSCTVHILYSADLISPDDIQLHCDNPDNVEITRTETTDDTITFSFSPFSDGVYNLNAVSADGSFVSDVLQIIVDPIGNSVSSTVQYIINTSSKTIHKMNCQHLPEKNRIVINDITAFLVDGYSLCQFCH